MQTTTNGHNSNPTTDTASTQPRLSTKPEATSAVGGLHRLGDLIPRRRDMHGNRLPWFYAHRVPTIADIPLQQTALSRAIAEITAALSITGTELEHYYEQKLRPALQRLLAIRDAEEASLKASNRAALQMGEALDKRVNVSTARTGKPWPRSSAPCRLPIGRPRARLRRRAARICRSRRLPIAFCASHAETKTRWQPNRACRGRPPTRERYCHRW